jgi:2-methylcitrate dehydratase PrpD
MTASAASKSLPGLFALADAMPVSGRDFLAAYVAGFETETRIARAVNFHHYDKGWHPTATLGIFGATAAASRLLELTQDQTATALAIAASFSSGLKANFGTMTKPLHVGHCARNGVMAAMLARAGMRGWDLQSRQFYVRQGAQPIHLPSETSVGVGPLDRAVDPAVDYDGLAGEVASLR